MSDESVLRCRIRWMGEINEDTPASTLALRPEEAKRLVALLSDIPRYGGHVFTCSSFQARSVKDEKEYPCDCGIAEIKRLVGEALALVLMAGRMTRANAPREAPTSQGRCAPGGPAAALWSLGREEDGGTREQVAREREEIRARIARYSADLRGWQEPNGHLVWTEPSAKERQRVRLVLQTGIDEADRALLAFDRVLALFAPPSRKEGKP